MTILFEAQKLLRSKTVLTAFVVVLLLSIYESITIDKFETGEIFSDAERYLSEDLYTAVTQAYNEANSIMDFEARYYVYSFNKEYLLADIFRLMNSINNAISVEQQRLFAIETALYNIQDMERQGTSGYLLHYNRLVYEHYHNLREPYLLEMYNWESHIKALSAELPIWSKTHIMVMLVTMTASTTLFAAEYENKTHYMIYACPNGRRNVYYAKLIVSLSFSLAITMIFWIVRWIGILDFPPGWITAPLQSIPGFEHSAFSTTLPGILLIILFTQILLSWLCCLLAACGALIFQNRYSGLCFAVFTTSLLIGWYLISANMSDFNISDKQLMYSQLVFRQITQTINPLYLICPGIYLDNFDMVNVLDYPVRRIIIPCVISVILTAVLALLARQLSIGRKYKPTVNIKVTE